MSGRNTAWIVDVESDDGRASLPTLTQVSKWEPEKIADTLVRTKLRISDLNIEFSTYQVASSYPLGSAMRSRCDAIRSAKAWHQAMLTLIQQAKMLPRKREPAPIRYPLPASVEAKAAATIARGFDGGGHDGRVSLEAWRCQCRARVLSEALTLYDEAVREGARLDCLTTAVRALAGALRERMGDGDG